MHLTLLGVTEWDSALLFFRDINFKIIFKSAHNIKTIALEEKIHYIRKLTLKKNILHSVIKKAFLYV